MKYVWVVLREKYPHYKDSFEISVEKVFGTKEAADRYVNGKYKDLVDVNLSENYILYEIDSHNETTYISIRKVEIEY